MSLSFDATPDEIKVFLEEAEEQLQLLDEDLIKLENDDENGDLLQEIFRAAHTLKGSSATIGHQRMAELTHSMESVLDKLRKGALHVNTAIIDALLESLDALRILLKEVETLEESPVDFTEVIAKLGDARVAAAVTAVSDKKDSSAKFELNEYEASLASSASSQGLRSYFVEITVDDQSPLMAARHFQVLIEFSAIGEVVKSIPSMEEIEAEQAGPKLSLILNTASSVDDIKGVLANICDIASADIRDYQRPTEAPAAAAAGPKEVDRKEQSPKAGAIAQNGLGKIAKTVRIDVERLDNLMNLVGELVIERTRLQQIGTSMESSEWDESMIGNLLESSQRVGRITNELQDEIMKSRMLPIENVFNKFPRVMRDLSLKSGKQVEFRVEGQETELDRSVIEEIGDPLIHLLRNAIDHGIELPDERQAAGKPETGIIRLAAFHQENHIVIVVEDDGRGIDPESIKQSAVRKGVITPEIAERMDDMQAIELIFQPGFSTAKVVSDVSGRGVGMDIVKTNVEKLNGFITIQSKPGHGSTFTITLPLTLAIIQALLVSVGKRTCAIPLVSVLETLRVDQNEVKHINGREAIILRDSVLPLIRLSRVFDEEVQESDRLMVVAAKFGEKQIGLVVDALVGQQEIVIKPLGNLLGDIKGISGATILGDGLVALIVDVPALVRAILREQSSRKVPERVLLAS